MDLHGVAHGLQTKVAGHPKLSVAYPESDGHFTAQVQALPSQCNLHVFVCFFPFEIKDQVN